MNLIPPLWFILQFIKVIATEYITTLQQNRTAAHILAQRLLLFNSIWKHFDRNSPGKNTFSQPQTSS